MENSKTLLEGLQGLVVIDESQRERKVGVEFKRADAPKITRSMQTVLSDLDLDEL